MIWMRIQQHRLTAFSVLLHPQAWMQRAGGRQCSCRSRAEPCHQQLSAAGGTWASALQRNALRIRLTDDNKFGPTLQHSPCQKLSCHLSLLLCFPVFIQVPAGNSTIHSINTGLWVNSPMKLVFNIFLINFLSFLKKLIFRGN